MHQSDEMLRFWQCYVPSQGEYGRKLGGNVGVYVGIWDPSVGLHGIC
jgi:hypothetical protein